MAAATFAALLALIASLENVYTARALVMLDRPATEMLDGSAPAPATDPFVVRSEVDLLWSQAVAERVVRAENLAAVPEFAPDADDGLRARLSALIASIRGTPEEVSDVETGPAVDAETARRTAVVESYQDRLGIANDGRSLAVGITVESRDPLLAARLANAHARAYIELKSEELAGAYQNAGRLLQREIDRSAQRLAQAERSVAEFRNATEILRFVGPGGLRGDDAGEVEQLRAAIVETERTAADRAATLAQLRETPSAASLMEAVRTPTLVRLRTLAADALVELRQGEAAFGVGDATVTQARARLAAADAAIAAEIDAIEEQFEAELARERTLLASLRRLIEDEADERAAYNIAAAEYRTLQTEAEIWRTLYEVNLERQGDLRLADGLLGTDATLVSLAEPPIQPSFPRSTLFLVLGVMVSGVIGLLTALAANAIWGRSRPPAEIAQEVGVPVFGVIPLPRRVDGTFLQRPATWQALRSLRSRLVAAGGRGMSEEEQAAVIGLTGAAGSDDRIVVAIGLSRAFAATGARTLLVDADPYRRTGTALLPVLDSRSGLADALTGAAALDALIVNGGQRNLDVLPLGGDAAGTADALASRAMVDLVDRMRRRYDYVLVLLPDSDAAGDVAAIGAQAGLVVAVGRNGRRAVRHMRRVDATLSQFGVSVSGLVLAEPRRFLSRGAKGAGSGTPAEQPIRLDSLRGRAARGRP